MFKPTIGRQDDKFVPDGFDCWIGGVVDLLQNLLQSQSIVGPGVEPVEREGRMVDHGIAVWTFEGSS